MSSARYASEDEEEGTVLVLNTGGTIGMLHSPKGLDTYPGYLADLLSSTSRFNDPNGQTIYANSRSVRAYKSWNASRSASPSRIQYPRDESVPTTAAPAHTPPSPDPEHKAIAYLSTGPVKVPTLVTPRTASGKRIRFSILEYPRLIDSSNMTTVEFLNLAADIERNYPHFSGFVILCGTDTLAYTASALSFLLENLGKSVILTGAQIPLSSLRNDAFENLLGALLLAGLYTIAEVAVFFHQKLYRGNRVFKRSAFEFDAFASPNMEPLASFGIDLMVDWEHVCRPTAIAPFRAHDQLCEDVGHLRFIPTMHERTLKAALAPPTRGLVLETYGSGNALEKSGWRDILAEATSRGVCIVNVTQCNTGSVKSAYAAGAWLSQSGVVSGLDMTTEAALAKLMYLLAKPLLSHDDVRALMMRPLRGEVTAEPPYITVANVDGVEVSSPLRDNDDSLPIVCYGSLMPELAPSTSADLLAHLTRLALPRRLNDLARRGLASELSALLANHPDADLDQSGCLHAAVEADQEDCVKLLLARGASVHTRARVNDRNNRSTPLALATRGSEVERLLLAAGAHVSEL